MSEAPVPQDPGRDENPSGTPAGSGADYPVFGSPDWQLAPSSPEWPEWMDEPGYLAALSEDDPGDGEVEEYEDPDNAPPPGMDDAQLFALIAEAREFTAEQEAAEAEMARAGQAGVRAALGSVAAGRGARGCPAPRTGSPASTPAGRRGSRRASRWMSRRVVRCWLSSRARPPGRVTGTAGVSDDELVGVVCGWDRVEANASAGKHAAVAELLRRRPAPGAAGGRRVRAAGGVG